MGLFSTSKVITAVERSERPRRVIQGNREWVTIIECVSSKRIHIPLWVILKAKEHQAAWYQESALFNKGYAIARSQNGWTTDEIGLRWLKEMFEPHSTRYSTSAKRLLILDGHSSHLTAQLMRFVKRTRLSASACLLILHIFFNHWMLEFLGSLNARTGN